MSISTGERDYIIDGINHDVRVDGRTRDTLRPFSLECDVIPSVNGSCRLRMDKTDILVSIKAEIGQPDANDGDNLGRVVINVDCSTNVCGQYERGEGQRLGITLTSLLQTILINSGAIPRHKLCLVVGKVCWILYIDVIVNSSSGNLLDLITLAIKAALRATVIPHITVIRKGGNTMTRDNEASKEEVDIEVSDDPLKSHTLAIWDRYIPLVISIHRVGNHLIVDPTLHEEDCVESQIALAFNDSSKLLGTFKIGVGCFTIENVAKCLTIGNELSHKLTSMLDEAFVVAMSGLEYDNEEESAIDDDNIVMDNNNLTNEDMQTFFEKNAL